MRSFFVVLTVQYYVVLSHAMTGWGRALRQSPRYTKDAEIQGLKAKLNATELAQKLAITESVNGVERERDELKNGLARHCETGFKETHAAQAIC